MLTARVAGEGRRPRRTRLRCVTCGDRNPGDAGFCRRCGARLGASLPGGETVTDAGGAQVGGRRLVGVAVAALAAIGATTWAAVSLGTPAETAAGTGEATADEPVTSGGAGEEGADPTGAAPTLAPPAAPATEPVSGPGVTCTLGEGVAPAPCPWWTTQLTRTPEAGGPSTGPAVADTGGGDTIAVGRSPDVIGLDARSGMVRWSTPVGPVEGLVAARDGRSFVVWTANREVLVLDTEGRVAWSAPEEVAALDAALTQGWVVVAASGGVHGWAVDGTAGGAWSVPVSGEPSPLGVGNGVVAVGDGKGDVRYVDVDTGAVRWVTRSDTWYTTVTDDGALVVTGGFGSPLIALDTRAGEIAWEAPAVVGWARPHVLASGNVAAQEGDGPVSVVDLASGGLVAEERALGRVVGTVDDWVLAFADGSLQAYDGRRADGSVPWVVHLGDDVVGTPAVARPRAPDAPLLIVVTADGRVVATPVPARLP